MNKIVEALRATPSRSKRTLLDTAASEIERLTDRCARYAEEIAVLQERTRWVPVEERLPKDRGNVLVVAFWRERWGVYMGWCAPERADWCVHVGLGDRDDVLVSHWMPLPEPPEVDESEAGDGVYLDQ